MNSLKLLPHNNLKDYQSVRCQLQIEEVVCLFSSNLYIASSILETCSFEKKIADTESL